MQPDIYNLNAEIIRRMVHTSVSYEEIKLFVQRGLSNGLLKRGEGLLRLRGGNICLREKIVHRRC